MAKKCQKWFSFDGMMGTLPFYIDLFGRFNFSIANIITFVIIRKIKLCAFKGPNNKDRRCASRVTCVPRTRGLSASPASGLPLLPHRAAVAEMLRGAASGLTDPSATAGGGRVWSPWTKRFPGSEVLPPRERSFGAPILSRQIFVILRHIMKPEGHLCVTCNPVGTSFAQTPHCQGTVILREGFGWRFSHPDFSA